MKLLPIKRFRLFVVLVTMVILATVGFMRLRIETDVVSSLPESDPVVAAGMYIFKNHPIQDRLFVDVALTGGSRDELVHLGDMVASELRQSNLFDRVGMDDLQAVFPELVTYAATHLPILFTARELERDIAPLLEPASIRIRMAALAKQLSGLEGIGQAQLITADPLGFKDLVLARLAPLAPTGNIRFYGGTLFDESGQHLLIMAVPNAPGTDTAPARKIAALMTRVQERLSSQFAGTGKTVTITPMGAYRAALDNEDIIRRDVKSAITLATLGIAALLLLAFPRPLIGLMSLLPAIAGTVMALFVYSFWHDTISIMVLGFGGAVISISVDHGIAYFLFADRPYQTRGREAAREVWAIGLVAALTTVGAFGALTFSGFPVFEQLGQFTALGIGFSFLFVHTVLPLIMPTLPAATRKWQPLQPIADSLASTGKTGLLVAVCFAIAMAFFARPGFNVDLSAMNTVSPETRAAEKLMTDVWGDYLGGGKVFVMVEAATVENLLAAGDRLLDRFERDKADNVLASVFVPSMITPGAARTQDNFHAWRQFWQDRHSALERDLQDAAQEAGFTKDAFEPFLTATKLREMPARQQVPTSWLAFFGVSASRNGNTWQQLVTLTTGTAYDPERFFETYDSEGRIFDPMFFPRRLGNLLSDSFRLMFLAVGVMAIVLLYFLFVDLSLTLIAMLPVGFALVCTLGTLRLWGHPIDIPGLMLAIVIFGMGIDYSIFFVRSYQRYRSADHYYFSLIRMAVLMASASTLIGFGVLCGADHAILKSAGFISLLGIGYALVGAFVILPPVLAYRFRRQSETFLSGDDSDLHARVRYRYRDMEAYPRMFARFKLMTDPMFRELPRLLSPDEDFRTVIDIGSGYGVPASWCLARYPNAEVFGIDPDSERIRIANHAVGRRGTMAVGAAPDLPDTTAQADCAFILDMIHYLTDTELELVLRRLKDRLVPGGKLVMRAVIPPAQKRPWLWWIENTRLQILNIPAYYRSPDEVKALLTNVGFKLVHTGLSGDNGELYWFIGRSLNSN